MGARNPQLDERGARPAVVLGCAVAAVGFWLWGSQLPDLDFGNQWYYLALAGADGLEQDEVEPARIEHSGRAGGRGCQPAGMAT